MPLKKISKKNLIKTNQTKKSSTQMESLQIQNGMFWHESRFLSPNASKIATQKSIHFQELFGLW